MVVDVTEHEEGLVRIVEKRFVKFPTTTNGCGYHCQLLRSVEQLFDDNVSVQDVTTTTNMLTSVCDGRLHFKVHEGIHGL